MGIRIEGGNNPGPMAHVTKQGKIQSRAVSLSEQSFDSINGNAFNINTKNITITSGTESALLYLKNTGEERDLIINRFFLSCGASTGGSGHAYGQFFKNISAAGGGIVDNGTDFLAGNYNFGNAEDLNVTLKKGSTNETVVGEDAGIDFLFPIDSTRYLVGFESIVIPRGASMAFTYTAPSGNTSQIVQLGLNVYLSAEEN